MTLTADDIEQAQQRLVGIVKPTPLIRSATLDRMKLLVEGAGATALAAALKLRPELAGRRIVICLSGGNIDINLLDRIIGYGLSKAARLMRFAVDLHDRPGELRRLLVLIGEADANVRSIEHDRTRRDVPIDSARVILELETRSAGHLDELRGRLIDQGYKIASDGSL